MRTLSASFSSVSSVPASLVEVANGLRGPVGGRRYGQRRHPLLLELSKAWRAGPLRRLRLRIDESIRYPELGDPEPCPKEDAAAFYYAALYGECLRAGLQPGDLGLCEESIRLIWDEVVRGLAAAARDMAAAAGRLLVADCSEEFEFIAEEHLGYLATALVALAASRREGDDE